MPDVTVRLLELGSCLLTHSESQSELKVSMSPDFGGSGGGFSATDLLAGALAACTATSIDSVAHRHGILLNDITISVTKEMATRPNRIARLSLIIELPAVTSDDVITRIERAARSCVVHKSLHPNVSVDIKILP